MGRIITLLTDFGAADTYVGQVKGSILSLAPEVRIVDLTHAVAPQDVPGGAFLLWSAVEVFPPASIHVAVVDPGVGTTRRGLAVESARGDVLVGPDNGLLVPAAEILGGVRRAVSLEEPSFWRRAVAPTFHGRDVFGQVAAHLANGVELTRFGPIVRDIDRSASWAEPGWDGEALLGSVIHVDVYGNLVTSLASKSAAGAYLLEVGGHRVPGPSRTYQNVSQGELLVLPGSTGRLEVCCRDGNAASRLGVGRGATVRLWPREEARKD